MTPSLQPEYFLISKDEINFMRISMFSDRRECRKIMQIVLTRPCTPAQSEQEIREKVLNTAIEKLSLRIGWDIPFAVKQGIEDSIEVLKELRTPTPEAP